MNISSKKKPFVSIVIPTHNRWGSLRRLLNALANQTYPLQEMEVVVVANGCTDETVAQLRNYPAPFALHVVDQPDMGPPGARNNGAARASGELLIFLDDDIEPVAELVEIHVQTHQPGVVVIGYAPPTLEEKDFLSVELKRWWMDMFWAMRQPGHRFTYRDFLSGNFSIEAKEFQRLGGFDTAFRSCLDDYEFGVRLLKANLTFVFAETAFGHHHETKGLERLLQRKYREGMAEVWLGNRHPDIKPTLLLTQLESLASRPVRLLRTLFIFRARFVGEFFASLLQRLLLMLEALHLRRPWRALLDLLMIHWFWRGVAEELKHPQDWDAFLQQEPIGARDSSFTIDLRQGIEAGQRALDEQRPEEVFLYLDNQFIGHVAPKPGAERLRGSHLRQMLATDYAEPYFGALVQAGELPDIQLDSPITYHNGKAKREKA
jgi:glycosyltransferase involved in cell wall biosynthesis